MNGSRFHPVRAAATLLIVLALPLASGCATNPATGQREFTLVSSAQELQIGQQGYPAAIAEYGLYGDARLAAYVDSIGQKLAKVSELPDLKWHFTLLDDPTVNAFAMPGGYIYVTRGILAHLNSEAQLAGVMGHEIGHVTARHSAKHLTQQELAGLGMGLAGAVSQDFRRYGGVAQQALGLLFLKYSRDDESQADALGIRYATAAGWDPREIPATYAMLKRIGERAGAGLPSFLSTHPDPGDREARTTALAAQAVAGRSGLIVRGHPYLDQLRGIVFGDDPRQGYFESGRFFHPQLGFELVFPAGWRTQNGRASLIAQEPQQKAALQLTLAGNAGTLSPSEYVAALRRDGRIALATGSAETIGGWAAWVGHVSVPQQVGSSTVLRSAWVRQAPDRLMQFIGTSAAAGDADDAAELATIRSLRPLQDAQRASPTPQRLKLDPAPVAGAFQSVLPRLGPNALELEDTAILNGVAASQLVTIGQWLKTIDPGRRR